MGTLFVCVDTFYARLNILPSQRSRSDPAIATMTEVMLNPVTSIPKNVPPIHPPIIAPMMPKMIEPKIPPLDECGSI